MISQKLIRHALSAQLLICGWILVKVFLLPYSIWVFLGTSSYAARIGDLSVIALATCAALSLGITGYYQAARFPAHTSPVLTSIAAMSFVHAPLFIYVVYRWVMNPGWDSALDTLLSGWLSIAAHPMILIGVYGKSAELLGTILLCASYLLGVWMYFDEYSAGKDRSLRMTGK